MKRFVRGFFKVCATGFTNATLFWFAASFNAPDNFILRIDIGAAIMCLLLAVGYESFLEYEY